MNSIQRRKQEEKQKEFYLLIPSATEKRDCWAMIKMARKRFVNNKIKGRKSFSIFRCAEHKSAYVEVKIILERIHCVSEKNGNFLVPTKKNKLMFFQL
jgi:hypothetical protein